MEAETALQRTGKLVPLFVVNPQVVLQQSVLVDLVESVESGVYEVAGEWLCLVNAVEKLQS